jgi:hypothetical protein
VFSTEEQAVRDALAAQGIRINKNPCTSPTQTDCTDVNGFRQSTMNAISAVNAGLGGNGFVITGGTEYGHAEGTYSHSNGYKFDIGQGSNSSNWNNIDAYFKGLTGSSNVSNNITYSVTVPSTGQRLDIRRETSGGLHWDIKALP